MIDIEKCKNCTGVSALVQKGLGETAINCIALAANLDKEVSCTNGPILTEGGWVKCHAAPGAQAGMRGAAELLNQMVGIETA